MGFTTDSITEGEKRHNETTLIYNTCPSNTKPNVQVEGYRPFMLVLLTSSDQLYRLAGLQELSFQNTRFWKYFKTQV